MRGAWGQPSTEKNQYVALISEVVSKTDTNNNSQKILENSPKKASTLIG